MGTPVPPPPPPPPPVPPGMTCVNCWGPGKPFGDGDTPESIIATFSGINKGPGYAPSDGEPRNGTYELKQIVTGCAYRRDAPPPSPQILFFPDRVEITLQSSGVGFSFIAVTDTPCETLISNDLTSHWIGGTCQILIPGTL